MTANDGAIELELEAIDVEALEAVEIEEFRLQISSAPKNETKTPWLPALIGVGLALLLESVLLVISRRFDFPAQINQWILAFGMVAPVLVIALQRAMQALAVRRARRKADARFSIRFDASALTIAWGEKRNVVIDLAEIDRFEARGPGVVLVRRNGTETPLPLAMPSREENEAMATRLETALIEARTRGGYRGLRVAEPEAKAEPEAEAEAETDTDTEEDLRRGKA